MNSGLTMSNLGEEILWDDILFEMSTGQSVLIIGPDLIEFEGDRTLFQMLCDELKKNEKAQGQLDLPKSEFFFHNEELLQLSPTGRDSFLYTFYKEFYEQRSEYDDPFCKIAKLPFQLIISFFPDSRLRKIFDRENRSYQFSYYNLTSKEPNGITRITSEKPLIYNIMGDVDAGDMVFTFDHLFTYLQRILASRPIPEQIVTVLQEAKSFLFLGVRFEKWYMQVLLRILFTGNNGNLLKYSFPQHHGDSDVSTFIARRLKLNSLEIGPLEFLNELHRRSGERRLLHKPKRRRVFISYSHKDMILAGKIHEYLEQCGITVIRDEISMKFGGKIKKFVESIQSMDVVVALISENSLRSHWVGSEILSAIHAGSVRLVPVLLDSVIWEKQIANEVLGLVAEKLLEIRRQIAISNKKNPLHKAIELAEEEECWLYFGHNFHLILSEIRNVKALDFVKLGVEEGTQVLYRDIAG